eukprot:42191_1
MAQLAEANQINQPMQEWIKDNSLEEIAQELTSLTLDDVQISNPKVIHLMAKISNPKVIQRLIAAIQSIEPPKTKMIFLSSDESSVLHDLQTYTQTIHDLRAQLNDLLREYQHKKQQNIECIQNYHHNRMKDITRMNDQLSSMFQKIRMLILEQEQSFKASTNGYKQEVKATVNKYKSQNNQITIDMDDALTDMFAALDEDKTHYEQMHQTFTNTVNQHQDPNMESKDSLNHQPQERETSIKELGRTNAEYHTKRMDQFNQHRQKIKSFLERDVLSAQDEKMSVYAVDVEDRIYDKIRKLLNQHIIVNGIRKNLECADERKEEEESKRSTIASTEHQEHRNGITESKENESFSFGVPTPTKHESFIDDPSLTFKSFNVGQVPNVYSALFGSRDWNFAPPTKEEDVAVNNDNNDDNMVHATFKPIVNLEEQTVEEEEEDETLIVEEEEIAKEAKCKRAQEAAKLFAGSNDNNGNEVTTWKMPNDLFESTNTDKESANTFANYDFEKHRGVDLEAEKIMNKIKTDPNVSFGVSGNDANESSNVKPVATFSFGSTSPSSANVIISEKAEPGMETEIFQHRPVKAWRWDVEQNKWRGRGKGQLTLYLNQMNQRVKIVFRDEKHNKTRLLQWIDGDAPCEFSPKESDDAKQDEVEWNGADYTMDLKDPMVGKWKLCFMEDESMAQEFLNVFNQLIAASNATDNTVIKDTEQKPMPFSFTNDDDKAISSFVNQDDESFTFNSMNAQTVASWTDGFKQNDDVNATETSGSFANIQWDFSSKQQETQAQEDNETTDNKPKKSEEDNMLKATFKPIVQLEEQKVDTGHENETLIAEIPFLKLYRFGKDVAQVPCWKIRASKSKIYFYKSNTNGKIRMIAREQETSKLRMNQFVPKSEDSAFDLKSSNVYNWQAYDSSIAAEEDDEAAGRTMWCIKLGGDGDYSETFENEFRMAMQNNDSLSGAVSRNTIEVAQTEIQTQIKDEPEDNMIGNEMEPTQNGVNEETEAAVDQVTDDPYQGWGQDEIAADKERQKKIAAEKQMKEKYFASNDENQEQKWEMPGNLFELSNANKDTANVFANYDFEQQRGVDLEAEKIMNRIQTDASISFGVSGNDADESSNVQQDFSNVTTRDNAGDEENTTGLNDNEATPPQKSGLGLNNFEFHAVTEDASSGPQWGDLSGGFSSVKPTEGFGNATWGKDGGGVGFGDFGDSGGFSMDALTKGNIAESSPKKAEDDVTDFTIVNATEVNEPDPEDNGNYTLKPIVSLEEVEVETGHDDERELKSFDIAKLYRWGKDVSQQPCWKARASKTSITFYQHNSTGKIRMVCRENITNKLRLNQNVAPSLIVALSKKSEKQISWRGMDSTIAEEDENDAPCMFIAKFAEEDTAEAFHNMIASSAQNNENNMSNMEHDNPSNRTKAKPSMMSKENDSFSNYEIAISMSKLEQINRDLRQDNDKLQRTNGDLRQEIERLKSKAQKESLDHMDTIKTLDSFTQSLQAENKRLKTENSDLNEECKETKLELIRVKKENQQLKAT